MKHHRIGLGFALALGFAAPSFGQQAVQWRVEDGGNGHWYQVFVTPANVSWHMAREQSTAIGGYLACLTTAAENAWVHGLTVNVPGAWGPNGHPWWVFGPWIGGYRLQPSDPSWKWVSGEPWSFTSWHPSQPDSASQTVVSFGGGGPAVSSWADTDPTEPVRSYIVEWSADCNGDGIVDYGQILDGTFADTNGNGVPDICEIDPCPGDINQSGVVNGIDLAAVLAYWGTNGGKFPRTDVNGDGIVDASDLAIVLGGWGDCP